MATVIPPPEVFMTWPTPNYIDPPSRANEMVAVEIPFLVLAIIVVGMRFYTRARIIRHGLAIDDYLTLGALIFLAMMVFLHLHGLKYNWGVHSWDMKFEWLTPLLKLVIATEIIFVICVTLTKGSILAFYLRVFASTQQLRLLTWIGMGLVLSCCITMLFLTIFQCVPVAAYWDLSITEHKCMNMYAALTAISVINSLNEVYIFAIPIPWILKLKLPRRQKIGLIVAFGLGLVTISAGLARVYYILLMKKTWDLSWVGVPVYSATCVEGALGIIAASLPALKPLVARYFPSFMSSSCSATEENSSARRRYIYGAGGRAWGSRSSERRGGAGGASDIESSRSGDVREIENASPAAQLREYTATPDLKQARMSSVTKPAAVRLVQINTHSAPEITRGGDLGPTTAARESSVSIEGSVSPSALSSKADLARSLERFPRWEHIKDRW